MRTLAFVSLLASLTGLALFSAATGCAGTKVSADLDVKVDPNACHEDPAHAAALNAKGALTGDLISLACTSLEGGASVHIEFPRTAWHALLDRASDAGPDASKFPGK